MPTSGPVNKCFALENEMIISQSFLVYLCSVSVVVNSRRCQKEQKSWYKARFYMYVEVLGNKFWISLNISAAYLT